jgi:hypothetical protein
MMGEALQVARTLGRLYRQSRAASIAERSSVFVQSQADRNLEGRPVMLPACKICDG